MKSKADDALITGKTERHKPNRRTAMTLAAGAAATVASAPGASAGPSSFSPEFLECRRLWDA